MGAALLALAATVAGSTPGAASEPPPVAPPEQAAQYQAPGPKTILALQQFRRQRSAPIRTAAGRRGTATLVELNPYSNAWYLLTLAWEDGGTIEHYHLENPAPHRQQLGLSAIAPQGVRVTDAGQTVDCDLWGGEPTALARARAAALPFAPLCGDRLYLRNPTTGRRSELERVTDFLRDHVWGGEAIIGFVREGVFRDAHLETARAAPAAGPPPGQIDGAPRPASIDAARAGHAVTPEELGIAVDGASAGQMVLGQWYPASDLPGIHVSTIQPGAIDRRILASHPGRVRQLDEVEASALAHLVAFDLTQLDLAFALGTDHPRLGWSARPPEEVRDASLPGPDGVGSRAPLVSTGMVAPAQVTRTVATFTGGFKRTHGAFRYGDLAYRNHGSHYGFVEQGVVFSKLQPGLATLYVLDDGTVDMTTWSAADDARLGRIRFARQNGVPLVEPDPVSGAPVPGALVGTWGSGNWSGSAEGKLRTLRAGACLQETGERRFLIYGYFSSATPSAMARVFQAYGCRYAMHLDMNALEHTYLALYARVGDEIGVQHLNPEMSVLDQSTDGQMVPRFVGFPDNRDFFYLLRREDEPSGEAPEDRS